MVEITIYKAEQAAGIDKLIRSVASVSYASVARRASGLEIPEQTASLLRTQAPSTAKASVENFDLHQLDTILVSTGWNLNDDVFDPIEVWASRRTPEHKPFNYEHDCSQIIGHIIGNHTVDDSGKELADNTVIDDLPAHFHILTNAVLYKYWAKNDLQERMDSIIAEIAEGKWFVSMEAMFRGFDYALKAQDGSVRVVARNEQTAFLSKHLRAYGGTGEYQGEKVGRVLRAITFSGKGLVRKPANPDSVIFNGPERTKAVSLEQAIANFVFKKGASPVRTNYATRLERDIARYFGCN